MLPAPPIRIWSAVTLAKPVPPWLTLRAVVRPVNDVMSEFAPDAAAPKFVRAPAAVVALVPPWPTLIAVVKPPKLVMSVLAPDAAAPRFVRAPAAVVAEVPPLPMLRALLSVIPANVGAPVVLMF